MKNKLKLKKGSSCLLHSSIIGLGLIKGLSISDIPKKIFDLIHLWIHSLLPFLDP